jgi:aspartate/glutamate racemase
MAEDDQVISLFEEYMKLAHVTTLEPEPTEDKSLYGKKLGFVNPAAWIQLWTYYFGRLYLPGVKLINAGNEAVQLNFMKAFREGRECPPRQNIELFARYAKDLIELADVDAIMITCSTMNRSFPYVQKAVEEYGVPVIQIDQPLMEAVVNRGGQTLVIATLGTTVASTRKLLEETAAAMGKSETLSFSEAVVEEAFGLLGEGRIREHNRVIAEKIRSAQQRGKIDQVVLAQLSMCVFNLSYPDPQREFGIPVLTSGVEGFKKARQILAQLPASPNN